MQSLAAMSGQLEAMARPEVAGFGDAKVALKPALRRPYTFDVVFNDGYRAG